MPTGLRLEPVTQENVRAACKLELRPDQEGLVAPVAWSLAEAYASPDVAWPRLVYDGDQLVGFIMAAFAVGHENPLFHSYLWRLAIGAEHQGKGYGRFAVGELCREATRRGHHRLTVSYHAGEHGPEEFYRRLGFHPTGEYNDGETVAERILLVSGDDHLAEAAQDPNGAASAGFLPLRAAQTIPAASDSVRALWPAGPLFGGVRCWVAAG